MKDEKYYIVQGENFFENDIYVHIVRKGMFFFDDETQMEDVLLTFCQKYAYDDEPDIPGYVDEWLDDWEAYNGCEICYKNFVKETEL